MPERARSRLAPLPPVTTPVTSPVEIYPSARKTVAETGLWWQYVPWLGVTVASATTTYLVLTRVSPTQAADILIPDGFLPLLVPLAMTMTSLAVVLWRHVRRGILTGVALTCLIVLKLNQVVLGWQLVGVILIGFVIIEAVSFVLDRLGHPTTPHHATREKTHHRRFDYRQAQPG